MALRISIKSTGLPTLATTAPLWRVPARTWGQILPPDPPRPAKLSHVSSTSRVIEWRKMGVIAAESQRQVHGLPWAPSELRPLWVSAGMISNVVPKGTVHLQLHRAHSLPHGTSELTSPRRVGGGGGGVRGPVEDRCRGLGQQQPWPLKYIYGHTYRHLQAQTRPCPFSSIASCSFSNMATYL